MSDRELLELAAKAAGIQLAYFIQNPGGTFFVLADDGPEWNPLTDDGDALRLAVKLQLTVCNEHLQAGVAYCTSEDDVYPEVRTSELCQSKVVESDYAATRRAIVRAAAEIGRGMNRSE